MQIRLFDRSIMGDNEQHNDMPTIGVAGITIPGAVDCINKINRLAHHSFKPHQHPNIILYQPDFSVIHKAQNEERCGISLRIN